MSESKETKPASSLGGAAQPPPKPQDPPATPPTPPLPPPAASETLTPEQERAALGLPEDAPQSVVDAARGRVPDKGPEGDEVEAGALNWLLGPAPPLEYDIKTMIDTPAGTEPLTFHIRQLDDTEIQKLEQEHTTGSGPFATLDRPMLNAAKAAKATLYMVDATGKRTEPSSAEFRGPVPAPEDAMRLRFKKQPGILISVAQEIDRVAGFSPERVGVAEKAMSTAVGNS